VLEREAVKVSQVLDTDWSKVFELMDGYMSAALGVVEFLLSLMALRTCLGVNGLTSGFSLCFLYIFPRSFFVLGLYACVLGLVNCFINLVAIA